MPRRQFRRFSSEHKIKNVIAFHVNVPVKTDIDKRVVIFVEIFHAESVITPTATFRVTSLWTTRFIKITHF